MRNCQVKFEIANIIGSYLIATVPLLSINIAYGWIEEQLVKQQLTPSFIYAYYSKIHFFNYIILIFFAFLGIYLSIKIYKKGQNRNITNLFILLLGLVTITYLSYAMLALYSMIFYMNRWLI